ncbi:MAG: nucleotide exchange factor GrpE, partial [Eubacteriales bacterium]
KETLYADGIAEAVEKLLPVLDNLERAVATDPASSDTQSVLAGVQKVLDQAQEVFGKLGVSEIPAKGEKFNPEIHNAVMHEESEDYEENTISDVFMKGYKLGDKVIRHSVVKVMN